MAKKILVIEDAADQAEVIQRGLEVSGYEVLVAYNGCDGLERTKAENPDLIITDILMPQLTGLQFVDEIRRKSKPERRIPIIVLTAKTSMKDFFQSGDVDAFLDKPFDPKKLLQAVQKLIGAGDVVIAAPAGSASSDKSPAPVPTKVTAGKHVMLVGVDEYAMDKAVQHLTNIGHRVYVALDENEVVTKAATVKPDIIFSQYFEDSARLDTPEIYQKLKKQPLTQVIPFNAFCKEGLAMDAMKTVKDVLTYRESGELVTKIDKYLKDL